MEHLTHTYQSRVAVVRGREGPKMSGALFRSRVPGYSLVPGPSKGYFSREGRRG